MSFSLFEISNFLGRPVCLYEFQWGNTFYRYTSADRNLEYGLEEDGVTPIVWTAIPIKDNGFSQGPSATDFTVTLPTQTPLVALFRSTPPSTAVAMTCRRFHKDDPEQEATVYWAGTIGNVKRRNLVAAEIIGLPITGTMRRTGLRLCWEVNCPHSLYDEGCKVDKTAFRVDTTVVSLTGTVLTVADLGAFPPERFSGGFVEWEATAEGTLDRRPIEAWLGGTDLGILGNTDRLVAAQAISVYLGCDLSAETCQSVFNNLPNHGGFKFMAKKSPFDGEPIF